MYKELDNIDPAFYNVEEMNYFRDIEREEKIEETNVLK